MGLSPQTITDAYATAVSFLMRLAAGYRTLFRRSWELRREVDRLWWSAPRAEPRSAAGAPSRRRRRA